MRALAQNQQRVATSSQATIPAPTKGWYVGANVADAPKGTALILINMFPMSDSIRLRRGTAEHATDMPDEPVETLIPWVSGTTHELFAAIDGEIYDVTTAGVVGGAEVTGLTGSAWQFCQFANSGGTWLRLVNGSDTPLLYDGASWVTSPAITAVGLTASNLINVWEYRGRLFFIEKNTLNVWYLAAGSIGGAAVKLPFQAEATLGGRLVAGISWGTQGIDGPADLCAFFTSEGEVIVYEGTDPASPSTWTKRGVYRIGRPLGYRCLMKAGADVAIMTDGGIVPLSQAMALDKVALEAAAATRNIAPAWRDAVRPRASALTWEMVPWQIESTAVINIPKLAIDDSQQFVGNLTTGAFCQYIGWDAVTWATLNGVLYYGTSDGRVMIAETGGNDDGALYTGSCVWAFTNLGGNKTAQKQIQMMRAMAQAAFVVAPQLRVLTDYDLTLPAAPSAAPDDLSGSVWGTFVWGTDPWGGPARIYKGWRPVSGEGSAFAPCYQVSVSSETDPELKLSQVDLSYVMGVPVG